MAGNAPFLQGSRRRKLRSLQGPVDMCDQDQTVVDHDPTHCKQCHVGLKRQWDSQIILPEGPGNESPFPCFPTETIYVEDKLGGTGLVEVAQG